MKVIFSHGKESGPWGSKIKALADISKSHGFVVESIDYSDTFDPEKRAERLLSTLKNETDDIILVGSSMGGYASLVASQQVPVSALFLLAPALYIDGYKKQDFHPIDQHTEIIHGWSDEIIPVQNSIKFSQKYNCTLHIISGDHRLNSSLTAVTQLFECFLLKFKEDLKQK